ncbi:protease inhibitor I42 family protein [Streptomyces qinglanensis]|uniref:protease inhibitor I42 family protein n=1 Tax=Streptomyces qinglanensis TaxID=943816 RepID=UPI00379EA8CA
MRTVSTFRISTADAGTGAGGVAVAAAAALALVAGCGSGADEPTPHPTGDTSVTAEVGERFTLTVNENASTREHWFLADPEPDRAVVRSRGRHIESDSGDEPMPGSSSDLVFTFEATGKGRTRIVLTHCLATTTCPPDGRSQGPTAQPLSAPERVTYTVTVS